MRIKIKALDTLFFRDGKPFGMDEATWADGIFPPPPSVFYGAIRSAYIAQVDANKSLADRVLASEKLKIKRIFIEIETLSSKKIMLFAPLDFVVENEGNEDENTYLLVLSSAQSNTHSSISNNKYDYLLKVPKNNGEEVIVENIEGGLLNDSKFDDYLSGQAPSVYQKISDVRTLEPKVGIGRDNMLNVADEGKLYRVGLSRLVGKEGSVNFIVEFEGLEAFPEKGFVKLGGEGKSATYEVYKKPDGKEYNIDFEQINFDKVFKVYLATPALFGNGWFPKWLDGDLVGNIPNTKTTIKLLTACVGKPISIGGFDIAMKEPKPMQKAVPAGSVYYFELTEGSQEDVFTFFHQNNISDEKANEGFGLAFVGTVNTIGL